VRRLPRPVVSLAAVGGGGEGLGQEVTVHFECQYTIKRRRSSKNRAARKLGDNDERFLFTLYGKEGVHRLKGVCVVK